jgi:RES domain-containing protein
MPDLNFRAAPVREFSGTVYRICAAPYQDHLVSMRGSFLHGARYNIRGYFGTLYTSLSQETARREVAQYFTVAPREGFVEAAISLRLSRILDLTNKRLLRKAGITWAQLVEARYSLTQEIGLRAWENGLEALLVPSAAHPTESNLAVFLDNQCPLWRLGLTSMAARTSIPAAPGGAAPRNRAMTR